MSDLIERLREEAQDNPDTLYWQAAARIGQLEYQLSTLQHSHNYMLRKFEERHSAQNKTIQQQAMQLAMRETK